MLKKILKYIVWSWVLSAVLGAASMGFTKSILPEDSLLRDNGLAAANGNGSLGQLPASFANIASGASLSERSSAGLSSAKTQNSSAADRDRLNELARISNKLLDNARDESDALKACKTNLGAVQGYNQSRLSSRCSCAIREIKDPPKLESLMGLVTRAAQLKHGVDIAPSEARPQSRSDGAIFTAQHAEAIIEHCKL